MASQNKFKTAVQNFAKKIVKPSKAKRVVAGAAIVGGLMLGGASASHKREAKTEHKSIKQTEFVVKDSLPQQKQTKVLQQKMDYSPVQLNSLEDMYTLFDRSLNIIFAELVLEEVPMQIPYDDYGLYKGKKNTVGVGSTYAPLDINDYNNPEAKWYHIASNQKIFANKTVSYEDMLKLVIGWAKYKTYAQNPKTKQFVKSQTVLERMFTKLKGCALTPNEFAAVFSAVYNNPRNLDKLCPIIRDNYKDKLKCANAIMFWDRNVASNSGLKDRCEFEANVFLNVDDFCEQMENFSTCPGRRSSCLGTKHVKRESLTKWHYKAWCKNNAQHYANVVYTSVPGVTVGEICNNKDVKKHFTYVLEKKDNEQVKEVRNEYAKANKYLAKGNYEDALEQFLNMEQQGVYGTDLLNDIAATYAQLQQYDKSLEYFKKILETGETQAYSNACYKAGSVCEQAGNYKDAIKNYELAKKYYKDYGLAGDNGKVKYEQLYQKSIMRAKSRQQSQKQISQGQQLETILRRKKQKS